MVNILRTKLFGKAVDVRAGKVLKSEMDYSMVNIPFGTGRRMCPEIPLAHRVVS